MQTRTGALIDGSSSISAIQSLASIFGTTCDVILSASRRARAPLGHWLDTDEFLGLLLEGLSADVPDASERWDDTQDGLPCAWFHASRVADPDDFVRSGILTLKEARLKLEPMLRSLAVGLHPRGPNPFGTSIVGKSWLPLDIGPHAFLLRSQAVLSPGVTHSYMRVPEFVEDFAGTLLGENYGQLVERFRSQTIPCLVKFRSPCTKREVARLAHYVLALEFGASEESAADIANTCLAPTGQPVPPEDVLSVERFDPAAF